MWYLYGLHKVDSFLLAISCNALSSVIAFGTICSLHSSHFPFYNPIVDILSFHGILQGQGQVQDPDILLPTWSVPMYRPDGSVAEIPIPRLINVMGYPISLDSRQVSVLFSLWSYHHLVFSQLTLRFLFIYCRLHLRILRNWSWWLRVWSLRWLGFRGISTGGHEFDAWGDSAFEGSLHRATGGSLWYRGQWGDGLSFKLQGEEERALSHSNLYLDKYWF